MLVLIPRKYCCIIAFLGFVTQSLLSPVLAGEDHPPASDLAQQPLYRRITELDTAILEADSRFWSTHSDHRIPVLVKIENMVRERMNIFRVLRLSLANDQAYLHNWIGLLWSEQSSYYSQKNEAGRPRNISFAFQSGYRALEWGYTDASSLPSILRYLASSPQNHAKLWSFCTCLCTLPVSRYVKDQFAIRNVLKQLSGSDAEGHCGADPENTYSEARRAVQSFLESIEASEDDAELLKIWNLVERALEDK